MACILIVILCVIIIILCIRLFLLKRSARELADSFADRMQNDTNTLADISSRDRDMVYLAGTINRELGSMRREHHIYRQGNAELINSITNISHDLRTPLTAICGYLDMLEETGDPAKRSHYISVMKERAGYMKELTEELFGYSLILSDDSEMETETVYVNRILEESIGSFYPALKERGIEPRIELTDTRIERRANKAALSRVLSNVLNNAVKYSDGDLDIILSESGEIIFSNTAKGLSPVVAGQLFDRFFTVESARGSTGLGLSIAKTLMERMGGRITAGYADERLTIRIDL